MYIGVTPSLAAYEDLEIDVTKTYMIKCKAKNVYLYSTNYEVTYDLNGGDILGDTKFHFVFEATGETSSNGNKIYNIRPIFTTTRYAYSYDGGVTVAGRKTEWCIVKDGEGNHFITTKSGSSYWKPSSGTLPLYVSSSFDDNCKLSIEALSTGEEGGGESGGNEGGGEEGETIDYSVNFDTKATASSRRFSSITLTSPKFGAQSVSPIGNYVYSDKTNTTFQVEAGEELNITTNPADMSWIFGYVYIDTDMNGFTAGIADDGYTPTGDMVSYSFYGSETNEDSGYNSKGKSISGQDRGNIAAPPSFNAPTTPGTYRMRIKFDWNSIDPKGDNNPNFGGTITSSNISGTIIDVMIEVVAADPVVTPTPINVSLAEITSDDQLLNMEGYIGTFSAPYATAIPNNVTAYYAQPSSVNGQDVISLTALTEGVVPENFGVLLLSNANSAMMIPASVSVEVPENAFSHSAGADVTLPENSYIFVRGDLGIGFYPAKVGSTLKANKTYLNLGASNVSAFKLMVDEVTAIESVVTGKTNSAIYDLSGRRVLNTVKGGIYIQNGKKFIVK